MTFQAFIKGHTHRQASVFLAWLDGDMDRPSRSDHYLMETMAEVKKILAKNPQEIKSHDPEFLRGHFGIKFAKVEPPKNEVLPPGFPRRVTDEDLKKSAVIDREIRIKRLSGKNGRRGSQ